MDELHRDMLGIGAGAAGAEDDELAAPVEADRHGVARVGHRARLPGQFPGGIAARLEQAADVAIVLRKPRR